MASFAPPWLHSLNASSRTQYPIGFKSTLVSHLETTLRLRRNPRVTVLLRHFLPHEKRVKALSHIGRRGLKVVCAAACEVGVGREHVPLSTVVCGVGGIVAEVRRVQLERLVPVFAECLAGREFGSVCLKRERGGWGGWGGVEEGGGGMEVGGEMKRAYRGYR